ncbi:cupin domain-containing protein [Sinobaca sp. H24]|uniref:cupin domain-containing protein n=1 Tax=Sinobaca sp. H24 TaxID=2923376 RepID=UPI002079B6B1|nr:cupin domain-containing protein [Sinobaca sp. H24]
MSSSNYGGEGAVFPKGKKVTNEYFNGAVWLHMLVDNDNTWNSPMGNVTFEPRARNNWHIHPGGQILLVTEGKGFYKEEGKPVRMLEEGDVVKIAPKVKHWHGATSDSWFTHIAISTNVQQGDTEWLSPVTDKEYNNIQLDF